LWVLCLIFLFFCLSLLSSGVEFKPYVFRKRENRNNAENTIGDGGTLDALADLLLLLGSVLRVLLQPGASFGSPEWHGSGFLRPNKKAACWKKLE